MLKSTEMRQELAKIKDEAKVLLNNKDAKIEDITNKNVEIETMQAKIDMQERLEKEELDNMAGIPVITAKETNPVVAFNKAVLGKNLTETENALVEKTGEDGGYLVPVEQKTQIEELKRQLIPLKQFCHVIPVGTLSGKMPLEVEATDELTNFAEMTEINQSTIKFGQTTWLLADYGDIIPISNTLLQDEKANLTNYVGRRFAKKAVRTENKKILELLATATKKAGKDYKTIQTALNKDLDPAISMAATIITNQDGYDYLDNLLDENKRPLMTDSLTIVGAKVFKGKRVVVLSNVELKSTGAKVPFYVGDIATFAAFFDRQAYEMAVSKEAGFTKYATYMRVVERFDVKKVDSKAVIFVEIDTTVVP